tara:strand:+ start:2242 stop:2424 length:183 start_codon:yes stop_codon:yes gene_type:complete
MDNTIEELKDKIIFVYDIDLDNCTLSHEDWAGILSEALVNPSGFVEDLNNDYHEMIEERL